jgi:hypothetical protein
MRLRRRIVAAVLLGAAALLLAFAQLCAPAAAADNQGTVLLPGWVVLDGTVTGPSMAPRHLSSRHAAAFIQSWYPAALYGTLSQEKPPANLPQYTVTINDRINGAPYKFITYYVSDGKVAWTGLPPQVIGPGAFSESLKWFRAPPRAIAAFQGKVDPVGAADTTQPTSPPTEGTTPATSGSSSTWAVVAVSAFGGLLFVLAIVAAIVVRARRRSTPARRSTV